MKWPLKNLDPYPVQIAALERSEGRDHFAYFMEMRLGKTPTVLADLVRGVERHGLEGLIVVCPNSLKGDWESQANEFLPIDVRMGVWPDLPPKGAGPFIFIINYEAFSVGNKRVIPVVERTLEKYKCMFVLDESAHIRNHKSQRTKTLLAISRRADMTRILSGEPVVRGPHDLWAQLQFVQQLPGKNYFAFRNRFCKMGGYKAKQVVGTQNEDELRKIQAECAFRATKEQWTDMPPKSYQIRSAEMVGKQKTMYRDMKQEMIAVISEMDDEINAVEANMVITQMMKLQQISSGFIIDEQKEVHFITDNPPKMGIVDEILEEVTGKTIIFAFYKPSIQLISERLDKNKVKYASLIGGMSKEEVTATKKSFNEDPECRVIVCQMTSSKYGHTLIGGPEPINQAGTMVFYENIYDFDTRSQCEERNRHPLSKFYPQVIDVVCSDVDKKALLALKGKRDVAREIVDGIKRGTV